jgi:hypothetical protein
MAGIITNGMQPYITQTQYTRDELLWGQCKKRGAVDSVCRDAIKREHDHYWQVCCQYETPRRCVKLLETEVVQDFMPPFQTDEECYEKCIERYSHKSCKKSLRYNHNEFIEYCTKVALISEGECSKRLREEIVKGFKP